MVIKCKKRIDAISPLNGSLQINDNKQIEFDNYKDKDKIVQPINKRNDYGEYKVIK